MQAKKIIGARRITLMRHGRPALDAGGRIPAAHMAEWIARYNAAAVVDAPPAAALQAAAGARTVVTSTLARATSSAAALGQVPSIVEACFNEADLPHALWRSIALPAPVWAALFRLAWLCGYAPNAASHRATQARARVAAQRLIDLAASGPVLLVGHGVMNRMISQELARLGWVRQGRASGRYWSTVSYAAPF